jgi:hypothetical protein
MPKELDPPPPPPPPNALRCVVCARTSGIDFGLGWEAHLTNDDPPSVACYCPDCASRRELGEP